MNKTKHQYSHDALWKSEHAKLNLLKVAEAPNWKILFRIRNTVVTSVLSLFAFWFNILLYTALRILCVYEYVEFNSAVMETHSIATTVAVFTLVFFQSHTYIRYNNFFNMAQSIAGAVHTVCMHAKACLTKQAAFKVYRLVNAAHILRYTSLPGSVYTIENTLRPLVAENNLLTNKELQEIEDDQLPGNAIYTILTRVVSLVYEQRRKELIGDSTASLLTKKIQNIRSACATLGDANQFPVPPIYTHFICLTTWLFLTNLSISLALNGEKGEEFTNLGETAKAFIIVLANLFFLGLMSISLQMHSPFGTDPADLSCLQYLKGTIDNSKGFTTDPYTAIVDEEEENVLMEAVVKGSAVDAIGQLVAGNGDV